MEKMDVDTNTSNDSSLEPDEGLYSRQMYTIGVDAMKKMATSNVLVVGLKGLGIEIAKNIILAGVKSVTIYDPERTTIADLSSQFFLSSTVIGIARDQASLKQLSELNPYVHVSILCDNKGGFDFSTVFLDGKFQVVVCTSKTMDDFENINEYARKSNVHFIAADTRGLTGFGFCDFGSDFTVLDETGEQSLTGMVASVTKEIEGVVACLDESRHGLQDGDYVKFSEIVGIDSLNSEENFKVKVLGPYTFSIGDTTNLNGDYIKGGIFTQVIMPKKISFKTLKESKSDPECIMTDFSKFDMPIQLHCAFYALSSFFNANARSPIPQDENDASQMVQMATEFVKTKLKNEITINEGLMKKFAKQAAGDLSPMAAVIGGLMAHEVLKACSGKLSPIKQFFYFDSFESLPPESKDLNFKPSKQDYAPCNSRYDNQIAVFGSAMQQSIGSAKIFLVGAGAIGCEMLKNWAMMGVGASEDNSGCVVVTDMDLIEKSNLNRQFLFRSRDIGQMKSRTALQAIHKMNPKVKIQSMNERVGEETEHTFNDAFWNGLDIVTNALDNVEARRYIDRRCVFFRKPLLESGTLGVKASTQVVIPYITESYSSSNDPPEKSIPLCTLKNFPNQIEHTIQWARDVFEGLFVQSIESAISYIRSPQEFVEKLVKGSQNVVEALLVVKEALVSKPKSYDCCVAWARFKFEELFVNNIKQLLYNFPPDSKNQEGVPFWSGPKRAPIVQEFDINNQVHYDFLIYAAMLRAENFSIKIFTADDLSKVKSYYQNLLKRIVVPVFVPSQGVKIQTNEAEAQKELKERQENAGHSNLDKETETQMSKIISEISAASSGLNLTLLCPAVFEKDKDDNHHIDVITACSNIRASAYKIEPASRFQTKFIAGKIIPAIATATALVTGLVCLELYKLLAPISENVTIEAVRKIERYRNSFLTLAGPQFAFSEPIAAPILKYNDKKFTLWDRFEIEDITLEQLQNYLQEQHNLDLSMMSCGVTMLYSFFMDPKKISARKNMKISQILELVRGASLPTSTTSLVLEVCCNGIDDEDADVPYVLVNLAK